MPAKPLATAVDSTELLRARRKHLAPTNSAGRNAKPPTVVLEMPDPRNYLPPAQAQPTMEMPDHRQYLPQLFPAQQPFVAPQPFLAQQPLVAQQPLMQQPHAPWNSGKVDFRPFQQHVPTAQAQGLSQPPMQQAPVLQQPPSVPPNYTKPGYANGAMKPPRPPDDTKPGPLMQPHTPWNSGKDRGPFQQHVPNAQAQGLSQQPLQQPLVEKQAPPVPPAHTKPGYAGGLTKPPPRPPEATKPRFEQPIRAGGTTILHSGPARDLECHGCGKVGRHSYSITLNSVDIARYKAEIRNEPDYEAKLNVKSYLETRLAQGRAGKEGNVEITVGRYETCKLSRGINQGEDWTIDMSKRSSLRQNFNLLARRSRFPWEPPPPQRTSGKKKAGLESSSGKSSEQKVNLKELGKEMAEVGKFLFKHTKKALKNKIDEKREQWHEKDTTGHQKDFSGR